MESWRMFRNYCCYYLNRYSLLVIWIVLNILIFFSSYRFYLTQPEFYYLRKSLGHGLSISRGSAAVLNVSCALVLLPVCRTLNSTVHRVLGRSSRYLLTFWFMRLKIVHIIIATTIVIASFVHSSGHVINAMNFSKYYNRQYTEINWAAYEGESPATLLLTSVVGVTGFLMLFLLVLMVLLSTSYVRRLDYDLFWGSHFLFVIFLVLFLIHPLKGVLKRQTNLIDHVPGCKISLNDSLLIQNKMTKLNIENNGDEYYLSGSNEFSLYSNDIKYKNEILLRNFSANYSNYSICNEMPVFGHITTRSWMWITGPLIIYLIDITLRIHSRNYDNTFIVKSAKMLPGDVVNIKIKSVYPIGAINATFSSSVSSSLIPSFSNSPFKCSTPSQYVLVQCPRLAPLEWHPFTVVNCVMDTNGHFVITLLIRIRGDWTKSICHSSLLSAKYSNIHRPLRLLVDGPFFSPIQNIVNSAVVICIAAGIGITPFAAILHHIVNEDVKKMCQPYRIHFVWVIRTCDQLIWIEKLLRKLYKKLSFQNHLHRFDFRLFITKNCSLESVKVLPKHLNKICDMENIKIIFGRRPDWTLLLSEWQQYYERGTVKVFLCGPPTLIDEVENVCNKLNKHTCGCRLKCIIESFT